MMFYTFFYLNKLNLTTISLSMFVPDTASYIRG
jgi:hypothetical protein